MTDVPKVGPLVQAVLARLAAAAPPIPADYARRPAGAGWPEGMSPTDADFAQFKGYAQVFGGGGTFDGTVVKPSADGLQRVQLTCVGATGPQADAIRDRARVALLGARLEIAGRWVDLATLDDEQPARLDDTVKPNLFFAVDRYLFPTTPA